MVGSAQADKPGLLTGLGIKRLFLGTVSAKTGDGQEELLEAIGRLLPRPNIRISVTIPFDRGDLVAQVHEHGEVLTTDYTDQGTVIDAMVDEKLLGQVEGFVTR